MEHHIIVGLDLGDRYSVFCILDSQGTVIEEGRVLTRRAALTRKFSALQGARVAMEADGFELPRLLPRGASWPAA